MTGEAKRTGQVLGLFDQGGILASWRPRDSFVLLAVLLSLLNVGLIWSFRFLPLYDYSIWLYETKILREFSGHLFPYHQYFEIIKSPVPNLAFTAFTWMFSWIVSYETAGKLFLSLCVVAFPWSVWYAVRRVSGNSNSSVAYLGFPFSFNLFMFGGHNYIFGMALLLWTLGYFVPRLERLSSNDYVLLALALIVIYFTHIIPFGLAVCFLLGFSLFSGTQSIEKRIKVLLVMTPSIAAFVWCLLTAPLKTEAFGWNLVTLGRSFFKPLCLFMKSYGIRNALPLTVLNGLWLLLLIIMILELLRRSWTGKLWGKRFLLPLLVCGLCSVLLPDYFLGIYQPGARFTFAFLMLFVLGIRAPLASRWKLVFFFTTIVATGYNAYYFGKADLQSRAFFDDLRGHVKFNKSFYAFKCDWPAGSSIWDEGSPSVNSLGLVPYYAYLTDDGVAWIHETGILKLKDSYRMYAPVVHGETISEFGSSISSNVGKFRFFRYIAVLGSNEIAQNAASDLKKLGYDEVLVRELWSIYEAPD